MLKNDKITKSQYTQAIRANYQGLQPKKNNATSELRKADDPYIKEVISGS